MALMQAFSAARPSASDMHMRDLLWDPEAYLAFPAVPKMLAVELGALLPRMHDITYIPPL